MAGTYAVYDGKKHKDFQWQGAPKSMRKKPISEAISDYMSIGHDYKGDYDSWVMDAQEGRTRLGLRKRD